MAALAVAHDLAGGGRFATQGTAELADEIAAEPGVEVDALADERGAAAVAAAIAVLGEGTDAAAQEGALEALRVAVGSGAEDRLLEDAHGDLFVAAPGSPPGGRGPST